MTENQINRLIDTYFFSKPFVRKWLLEAFPDVFSKGETIKAEAIRRGYREGAIIDDSNLHPSEPKTMYRLNSSGKKNSVAEFKYYPDEDMLHFGNNFACIYRNGVWATIVPPTGTNLPVDRGSAVTRIE